MCMCVWCLCNSMKTDVCRYWTRRCADANKSCELLIGFRSCRREYSLFSFSRHFAVIFLSSCPMLCCLSLAPANSK